MLVCQTPFHAEPALLTYQPDLMDDGNVRTWMSCKRFAVEPPKPIQVSIDVGESGLLLDMYDVSIAVMSRKISDTLLAAGVSNIDFYDVVIHDVEKDEEYRSHVAFNVVGSVSIADLSKSSFHAPDGPLISVDFDSLAIDERRARGALFFRLAESVNGIVVHEKIRTALEHAGIQSLTFFRTGDWAG